MRNFIALVCLYLSAIPSYHASPLQLRRASSLSQFAIQKVLGDASPIFGEYTNPSNSSKTANWMKAYSDSTKIVHMNIPGTHDSATWNYSQATQDALAHIAALNGLPAFSPEVFRCQDSSIITMLNSGIRAFDLRYAFDPTNSTLIFYHSQALLSETATVEDVLFSFYKWLEDHPSEALFLSMQYEGSTALHASNNADVQLTLYNTLTSPAAKRYISQTKSQLGTLGEARGKITLFRRFDMDRLPPSYEASLPGLHFSPSLWPDNGPNITLIYNTSTNATAYIEDFYEPSELGKGSSASANIQLKYDATTAHILQATTQHLDSLFWTWASSEYVTNIPADTPRIMATGNGTLTPDGGVNQRLLPFLKSLNGKRMGFVMFDFFDTPGNLVETFLGL
ncbi:PLC-like phosphodiesterase [Tricladium varicosporioides]|nr:PLC-like phosphodiesterase [Hymenoscyphus varicosporioides]